jgi:hypothetical protein
MKSSDSDGVDSVSSGDRASSGKPARRALRPARKPTAQPSRAAAAGRRAQQAAREGAAAVGKGASERVADAARKAKVTALPGLSRAKDGARRWSSLDADVKQQVISSLLAAAVLNAGEHMKKHEHLGVRLAGLGISAAAPAVAKHASRQVGKAAGDAEPTARSAETEGGPGPADQRDYTGDAKEAGAQESLPSSYALEPAVLSEFTDALGVRRPPDPEALYREGADTLEPLYPLPEGLASLPWGSVSRRNRFFILVAAWALREADGIQLLKSGQLEHAREVFQECLIRAQHMQSPELASRSCEDLGELAVVSGDEADARNWRVEAERWTRP